MQIQIEKGQPSQAADIVMLMDMAGYGIPSSLWTKAKEHKNQSPLEVGRKKLLAGKGGFALKNTIVAKSGDAIVGMGLGYVITEPNSAEDIASVDEPLRPLLELENELVGAFYLNAGAAYEEYRRSGIATQLVEYFMESCRQQGIARAGSIVDEKNKASLGVFAKLGFEVTKKLTDDHYTWCIVEKSTASE